MTPEQILEVVRSVEGYYNDAWLKLLAAAAAVLVAFGVLWVLLVRVRSRHRLYALEMEIERRIRDRLQAFEKRLDDQTERLERAATESVATQGVLGKCVEAMLFHVQGVADLAAGRHSAAIGGFISACQTSLASGKGEDTFTLFYRTLKGAVAETRDWSTIADNLEAARRLIESLKTREETVLAYFAGDLETAIAERRTALIANGAG